MNTLRRIHDKNLQDKGFELHKGWNDRLASALASKSIEAIMLQNVPNDHAWRFSDEAAASRWMWNSPDRLFYSLYKYDDLAGVVWFTPEPDTESTAGHTFAMRLYDNARGQSLGLPFMQATHADALASDVQNGIWLETDESNAVARALYTKFGYQTTSIANNRVHMVYNA